MKIVRNKIALTKQDAEKLMAFLSIYVVLDIIDFDALAEAMIMLEDMTSRWDDDRWEPLIQLNYILKTLER